MHNSELAFDKYFNRTKPCLDDEMKPADESNPEFDKSAREYEKLFKPWLKIAGAPREYFARSRLNWLSSLLIEQKIAPKRVMDFGCGTGMSLPLLADILGAESIIGLDTSEESLAVARESMANRSSIALCTPVNYFPRQDLDLVFCNGVFHHIPIPERPAVVDFIYRCLRPGGLFALWENNPWNPLHSFAMKHSEIDKNAIPLAPPESRQLLAPKFTLIRTDFLFFSPGYFSWLHPFEKLLIKVPLGAQYQVLAHKD